MSKYYRNIDHLKSKEGILVDAGSLWKLQEGTSLSDGSIKFVKDKLLILEDDDLYATFDFDEEFFGEETEIIYNQYSLKIYHFLDVQRIVDVLENEITAWNLSFKKSEDFMKLSFKSPLKFERINNLISEYGYSGTLEQDY